MRYKSARIKVARSRPRIGVVFGFTALLLAVGVLFGLGIRSNPRPDVFRTETTSDSDDVWQLTPIAFRDERTVEYSADFADAVSISQPAAGLVTTYSCPDVLESGTSSMAVDGAPLLFLATDVPLWRDLRTGDNGADVRALRMELHRLGEDIALDGPFDKETLDAINVFEMKIGGEPNLDNLSRSRIIWLPEPLLPDAACGDLVLGGPASAGDVAYRTAPILRSLRPTVSPADLVTGSRDLSILGTPLHVDSSLQSADAAALDRISRSTFFAEWRAAAGAIPLTGTVQLAAPLSVAAVPPSSVLTAASGESCVVNQTGSVVSVEVVASRAGQTLVRITPGVPLSIRVHPGRASCG